MSVKKYFKKRNWTRKSFASFRENLAKYLAPKEYASLPLKNDLDTFHVNPAISPTINKVSVSQSLVKQISQEIQKEINPRIYRDSECIQDYDNDSGYLVQKDTACDPNVLLDFHKWSKKFPFFHVANKKLNPAGDKWLLSIDFVGDQTYHLFTKSLYADDYHRIKLPSHRRLHMNQLMSDGRTASYEFCWLDNTRFLYVSLNKYYNDSGIYMYNLKTQKHKLVYKNTPGFFIQLKNVTSGLFVLLYSNNYDSNEVYVIDVDTLKVELLLKREFSVNYPYLNHEKGQWIVCKRDKGRDILATTLDFKTWDIHYQNNNPYEQILDVFYQDLFLFTLQTLSGIAVYALKCKKLTLLEKSFDGYELNTVVQGKFKIYKHKYTCPKMDMMVSLDNLSVSKMNVKAKSKAKYHEEEVFIHPHLRVTLLYKTNLSKKSKAPCLLRGYGGYNEYIHPSESVFYYPLLERGFVIAIAHVRGGGEYGYKGYDEGRLCNKKNSFQDFIDTAHYLIDKKWTTRDKLAIWGRSFGGLLIASVLNQEPDLCKVALLGVPFVAPLETMGSYESPMGIETQSELGEIKDKKVQAYIRSYDPLENIQKDGNYPNMLIYTNRNDTSVPYKEPWNYYQAMKKVEVYQSGSSDLSFHMDTRFGHNQGTLRKDRCDHYGMLFAYVLKKMNIL